jgi:hypothetical protein
VGVTNAPLSDSQTDIIYAAGELAPEEVDSLAPGTIIEIDREQMRVTDHDEASRTLTVARELYGTTKAAHPATSLLSVAPRWPRQPIFDAVADEIESLYPDLYGVSNEWAGYNEGIVALPASPRPGVILEAKQFVGGEYVPVEASIVEIDDVSTGFGVQFAARSNQEVYVRYSTEPQRPTTETDTLASLGVESAWQRLIMFGVLGAMMLTGDIDAVTQEFVTEALESQGYPATTSTSLAVTLTRLRQTELGKAVKRQRARRTEMVEYRREL